LQERSSKSTPSESSIRRIQELETRLEEEITRQANEQRKQEIESNFNL